MKHIDIKPLIEAVKNIEFQQVKDALRSCGRKHSFDPENPPSVEFYGGAGPASATVKEIRLSPDEKKVTVEVWDDIDGGTYELEPGDIYPGLLIGLVSYM